MNPMFRMWRCYFSGLLDAGRWRMFLHSRMWLGLPVAAVAAFVVIFLLRRFGGGGGLCRHSLACLEPVG